MNRKTYRVVAIVASSLVAGATLLAQVKPAVPADAPPAAAQPPVDPAKVVLVVGDSKMTAGEFNDFISGLPPEVQNMAKGPQKRRVAEDLLKLKLLAAEAKKQGLDQSPKFKAQMDMMRDNALAGLLFTNIQTTLVKDEDLQKYYDAHKGEYEQVTVRHILVRTPAAANEDEQKKAEAVAKAKAEDIKKQLTAKPDSFAAIAKAESADPGSKDKGGELPAFPRGQMAPEFEDAAFRLKPNEISDPVKTSYGYHIIQLLKRETPPLDDVKEAISEQIRPQKLEAFIEGLKKNTQTQIDETFFGPPAKPAAPANPAESR